MELRVIMVTTSLYSAPRMYTQPYFGKMSPEDFPLLANLTLFLERRGGRCSFFRSVHFNLETLNIDKWTQLKSITVVNKGVGASVVSTRNDARSFSTLSNLTCLTMVDVRFSNYPPPGSAPLTHELLAALPSSVTSLSYEDTLGAASLLHERFTGWIAPPSHLGASRHSHSDVYDVSKIPSSLKHLSPIRMSEVKHLVRFLIYEQHVA